jgi:CRP-like cAMP-binding protein
LPDIGHQRLIRRLIAVAALSSSAGEMLNGLPFSYAQFLPQDEIYAPGVELDHYLIVVDGSVCRYKVAASGAQAICSFEFPGDILNVENLRLAKSDCGARAVSSVEVAYVSRSAFDAVVRENRELDAALQRYALIRAVTAEEWLLNVGRRPDRERVAHLICEMVTRAKVVDALWDDISLLLPSSDDLAGATGLSVVQTTRALRDLADEGAIGFSDGSFSIRSIERLEELGRFKPDYLHLVKA